MFSCDSHVSDGLLLASGLLRSVKGRRTDGLVMWTPDIFPRITMYVVYMLFNACRNGRDAFDTSIYFYFLTVSGCSVLYRIYIYFDIQFEQCVLIVYIWN